MKHLIKCPCEQGADTPSLVGSASKADEYGIETKFTWFDDRCGHYVFLVIRAPFVTHGRGGEYELTHTVTASTADR